MEKKEDQLNFITPTGTVDSKPENPEEAVRKAYIEFYRLLNKGEGKGPSIPAKILSSIKGIEA